MEYPKTERKEGKSRLTYDKDTNTIIGWDLAKPGSEKTMVTIDYEEYKRVHKQAEFSQSLADRLEGMIEFYLDSHPKEKPLPLFVTRAQGYLEKYRMQNNG